LQPKSLAGQEKREERTGNTVERFDEPGSDFRCNLKGRGPFGRWRCCSSLMIVKITSLLTPSQRPKCPASRPRK
jgi:hypothetical protein